MRRRIPPLAALRAFEAAARHLSFSRAGEELLVGQSAVSHHVRILEEHLGVLLFVRRTRAVSLTPEGQRYLAHLSKAFDTLAQATEEVMPRPHGLVRVRLLACFAAHWLVPRLNGFRQLHPDIDVALEAGVDVTDLDGSGDDLAIRYGRGDWSEAGKRKLMDEVVVPVMSPALLAKGPAIDGPSDLVGHELLAAHSRRGTDWETWLGAAGLRSDRIRLSQLHDYNIVLQAALQGQGVAMGRERLVADKVAAGLLVRPISLRVDPGSAWWVVLPRRRKSAATEAFLRWIEAEAASLRLAPTDAAEASARHRP